MQTRNGATLSRANVIAVCVAIATALIISIGAVIAQPGQAFASTGYTATATPYYRNPATGVIEDSGGENSEVLGQSMTEGCVSPVAFLEIDDAGNRYVTLRLGLMDNINNVNILADDDWTNSYYQCAPQTIAVDDATTDFRMLVGSEGAIFRINMYVVPMGREVIFYVALSGFSEGNPYGFYMEDSSTSTADGGQVVSGSAAAAPSAASTGAAATTGSTASASSATAPSAASSAAQQLKAKISEAETQLENSAKTDEQNGALQSALDEAKAVQQKNDATDDELKAAADKLGDALTTFKNALSENSTAGVAEGIEEYDASGNRVSEETAADGTVNIPVSTLVVGGVLLLVIVGGVVWFFAYYRPRHTGGVQNAAVAAAMPADGAFHPYKAGPAVLSDSASPGAFDNPTEPIDGYRGTSAMTDAVCALPDQRQGGNGVC